MRNILRYLNIPLLAVMLTAMICFVCGQKTYAQNNTDTIPAGDTIQIKDVELPYEFDATDNNPNNQQDNSPLYGEDPSNVQTKIVYDPVTGSYIFKKVLGDSTDLETPYAMPLDEYINYDFEKGMKEYWRQRYKNTAFESQNTLIPKLEIGGEAFDRIFGSNNVSIKPQGSAELRFGINVSTVKNNSLPIKNQRQTIFDFKEKIQMNVVGQIGEKMKINVQYDTEAAFDFENSVKIEYTGHEDEIIQKIEAGNVSLPLTGSLIQGSQSLFGFKTELKFGRLTMTSIFSQKKGETSTITVEGGAQLQQFKLDADEYEANKHFFLAHYFKENYDKALSTLPIINSGITITRLEVWVTNTSGNFENSRNIIAFPDLGESNMNDIQSEYVAINGIPTTLLPSDSVNLLYRIEEDFPGVRDVNTASSTLMGIPGTPMTGGVDFEKIESARLLSPSEYTFQPQLGYISLNSKLASDQVMAVAFEYTMNGKTYRVGEFSNAGVSAPNALILKVIKGTSLTPKLKTWDLMMKNVYSIGAYQVTAEDFIFDIMYRNDKTGTPLNYIPAGAIDSTILLRVMNLDNLNSQLDPFPDGMYDFINNVTIRPANGRVIFPVREPFGSYLHEKIVGGNPDYETIADEYVFQELYDSTQSTARQMAEKNKFYFTGHYKSSSGSEISLNAINIPEGSVVVSAGGVQLLENQDYTVDYNLGRVKIINEGILESGTPISISLESNSLFNIKNKVLVGTHLNYEVSKDFNLGATILNLTEKPLTKKVSFGDEPISNTIWGVNGSYRSEVPFLTKAVDWLPFIETKEKSSIIITGEFAQLIPGHPKVIDKEGNAYIDDFEGSETNIDIKSFHAWNLASTPADMQMFPEAGNYDLSYGKNRAKLAWFVIDRYFHTSGSPVSVEQQSSHYVREIFEQEIFPNKDSETGTNSTILRVLNLTYYPNLKGPYNFDIDGLNADGTLQNPKSRWGGIMRDLTTNDFEEANIEYIEFWMMDPFVEDETNPGGDLYFNLGNVSEDILKDSRKSFENGLPTPFIDNPIDTTVWGFVPLVQSLTNAFDNEPESRKAQDVGLDGMSDEMERIFYGGDGIFNYLDSLKTRFGIESQAYINAQNDPSSDNYHFFRGDDYDEQGLGILERYAKYNGLEGNSPVTNNAAYSSSARNVPDVEDINGDNTLNESESFYQYKISIRPEDLEVGKNFITDKIEYTAKFSNDDKSKVTWYQFKVPITGYDKKIGTIEDFKSIRFLRMFLTNFEKQTVMRFGSLDLVRGEWRKYNRSFIQPGEYIADEIGQTPFDVTAVNIEENSRKIPVNYVLPPGVDRQNDVSNPQLRQLNEQAMVLKVIDLADGDARAVYKNINMDIRKYKRLKMFIHAEEIEGYPLENDELSVFIRLGSDYQNNYYEYEIPLKLTEFGVYDNDSYDDRELVWPVENNVDFEFELLQRVKQKRNEDMRSAGSGVTLTRLFSMMEGNKKISVMGNPNLSNVQTVMIGVRNPKKETAQDGDDGAEKSGEIWVNELRLTDFDEKGGWAANARMTTRLADFGSITISGETSKPGFGAINQKVNERQKEEINSYNITSNFELGKFFPQKAGVRIPMYIGYSEAVSNPEYNPLDPDIPFKVALNDSSRTKQEKDSLRYIAQNYTRRKSLNFTNVKVAKSEGKAKIYDLANWSASYSYNEIFRRDVNTRFNTNRDISGSLAYNYNATPKNVQPFKSVKFLNKPIFRLIKDFNFYYLPSQLSFRTNLVKTYHEVQLRNVSNPYVEIPLNINKNFLWTRQYDFKYNFSKSLKFDFSATNNARIDEPQGRMWKDDPFYKQKRDTIWNNLKDFGRNTQYNHRFNATYQVPVNKVPLLNWISANARYNATYDWIASPITADTINMGNTIQNSNTVSLTSQFNLLNFYNKVGYLKEVNQKYKGRSSRKQKPKLETVTYEMEGVNLKKDKKKRINHKLKTEDVTIKVVNAEGKVIDGDLEIINDKQVYFIPKLDSENSKIIVTGKREETESIAKKILDNTLAVIMSTKNISVSYSGTNGTLLPGFLPRTQFFGMSNYSPDPAIFGTTNIGSVQAPSIPFVLGWQDRNFGEWARDNYMLTRDSLLNQPYVMSKNETWNIRASLEPINRLRIDLNVNRTYTENLSEYYNWDFDNGKWNINGQMISGNFSMTTITWGTAFEKISKKDGYPSQSFGNLDEYRRIIAFRLAEQRGSYNPSNLDENGYPVGFGKLSQDVMIPAFLAAYTGKDPKQIALTPFPSLAGVLPNWRITYDGLAQIPFLQKYLRTANLTHVYRSTYNVGNFNSRLNDMWNPQNGFNYITDANGNYYSQFEIGSISLTEQFSPLIGVDMNWQNSLITKIEFKRSRNLNMSFANNQLTEMHSNEYVIGGGYRIKDVEITVKTKGGRKRTFKSDLNLRLDLSLRDNFTIIRKLEEGVNQLTAGTMSVGIKASADYVLSDRFNLRLFYDHAINRPKVSSSFNSSNVDFGVSIRFMLAS